MSTAAAHLILNAVTREHEKEGFFRVAQVVKSTGLSKQLVYYHINSWEKNGFVARNPLDSRQRLVTDLAGLLEWLATSDEFDGKKSQHMGKHDLFDEDAAQQFRDFVELYAAFKGLSIKTEVFKAQLEKFIDSAISQLRTERAYMHTRRMEVRPAAKAIRKHRRLLKSIPGVSEDFVMKQVEEILGSPIKDDIPKLRLVTSEEESLPVAEEPEVDPQKLLEDEYKELMNNVHVIRDGIENKGMPQMEKYLGPAKEALQEFLNEHPEFSEPIGNS